MRQYSKIYVSSSWWMMMYSTNGQQTVNKSIKMRTFFVVVLYCNPFVKWIKDHWPITFPDDADLRDSWYIWSTIRLKHNKHEAYTFFLSKATYFIDINRTTDDLSNYILIFSFTFYYNCYFDVYHCRSCFPILLF